MPLMYLTLHAADGALLGRYDRLQTTSAGPSAIYQVANGVSAGVSYGMLSWTGPTGAPHQERIEVRYMSRRNPT
jgi:hypothetical protein